MPEEDGKLPASDEATEEEGKAEDGQAAEDTAPEGDATASGDDAATEDHSDGDTEAETGTEDEDSQPLTPEQVKNLPPEMKATYRSLMQWQQRQAERVKAVLAEVRGRQTDGSKTEKPVYIDRQKLAAAKTPEEIADVLEEGIVKAAEERSKQAVNPILQDKAKAEVESYFGAHPERAKYRKDMAKLDAATGESMSLDQLYYAVSGSDREKAAARKREERLRDQANDNAESPGGTQGSKGDTDVFDEMAAAGGHDNSILR